MNEKQIKNIAILAGIVAIVAVALTLFNALQSNVGERFAISESVANDVNKIQFDTPEGSYALQRTDDNWKIDEAKADNQEVKAFLDLLKASKIVNTASTNSNNYNLFNVDDENGTAVGFYNGETKLLTLVIGKSSTTGNFIRFDGDPNVYEINKNLAESGAYSEVDFKDRSLTKGDISNLDKVKTNSLTLLSTENGYSIENSSEQLDQTKAQNFANNISNLVAYDFATAEEVSSLNNKNSTANYEVIFKNGDNFKFEVFKVDEDNIFAKRDDGVVLKIYDSQFDGINYSIGDLK